MFESLRNKKGAGKGQKQSLHAPLWHLWKTETPDSTGVSCYLPACAELGKSWKRDSDNSEYIGIFWRISRKGAEKGQM